MSTAPTGERAWTLYSAHKRLVDERQKSLEKIKHDNTLYLPLLGSTWKQIENDSAQKQMDSSMALLSKCVYILRGTTPTIAIFGGLVQVEYIGRSNDRDVCTYLGGPLTNESGVIYEDLVVRVAIHAHTYISYR